MNTTTRPQQRLSTWFINLVYPGQRTNNTHRQQGTDLSEPVVSSTLRGKTKSAAQPTVGTDSQRPATTRDHTGRFVAVHETRRFVANIQPSDGCWLWTGLLDRDGYPVFKVLRAGLWTYVRAHRWAYETEHGPIPLGLTLDHRCHTLDPDCPGGRTCLHRRCVRVDHLDAVTSAENRRRAHARRTHRERP